MAKKIQNFSLIVAVGKNREIGFKNDLPWGPNTIKGDLTFFANVSSVLHHVQSIETAFDSPATMSKEERKQLLLNPTNVVIMGRNSWESIPLAYKPLPMRRNIVVTRNPDYQCEVSSPEVAHLASTATSLEEALEIASALDPPPKSILVTGGTYFYAESLKHPKCTNLFITEILSESNWEADTFFPEYKHLSQYEPHNITNAGIEWMTKVDPSFVKSKLPKLIVDKEEGTVTDAKDIKYKFMLYKKPETE